MAHGASGDVVQRNSMSHFNRIKQSPASIAQRQSNKQWVGILLVSGVVQATPDKLRSSYSVMSK